MRDKNTTMFKTVKDLIEVLNELNPDMEITSFNKDRNKKGNIMLLTYFEKNIEKLGIVWEDEKQRGTMEKINNYLFTHKYTNVYGGNKSETDVSALHDFEVRRVSDNELLSEIHFQQGPIKECGVNGVMNEDLLLMIITRLEKFQESKFKCDENEKALERLREAVMWLRSRTLKREVRGIEGTHEV